MNEANETYRTASAIAAFDAIQVAFTALVKKGILSKAEAEQILKQAIETIKTGGAGDQATELFAIALEFTNAQIAAGYAFTLRLRHSNAFLRLCSRLSKK
jgi:hypothetical protein